MCNTTPQRNDYKNPSGLRRLIGASRYSLQGLACSWRSEAAFREEVVIGVPAIIVALLLPVSRLEMLALVASIVLVWIVELINSAIESVVDRVSLERHPLSGNAKDQGSAAVLLALLLAGLTWALIALPLLW